jgi:predicted nucleotidyltransferase
MTHNGESDGEDSPTKIRRALARMIWAEVQATLGAKALAGAVYGSVAHGSARRYSDLELVVLTTDGVPPAEEQFVRHGILVELDRLPASRMLAAASQVTPLWGIEADQYRYHWEIWDPERIFAQVRARATSVPDTAFRQALHASRYRLQELWGKFLNAAEACEADTAFDVAWRFAHAAAMRLALRERRPFERGRTLWREARERSAWMDQLVDALIGGQLHRIRDAMKAVLVAEGDAPNGLEPCE